MTRRRASGPLERMGNVLSDTKREQVLALGRLGWSARRIGREVGVRRETASAYLRAAGIEVRPADRWGHAPKPALGMSTDAAPPKPALGMSTDSQAAKRAIEVSTEGAKSRLFDQQRDALRETLLQGARAHGWHNDRWTLSVVEVLNVMYEGVNRPEFSGDSKP